MHSISSFCRCGIITYFLYRKTQQKHYVVRIAEIEADSTYIDSYNAFLREETGASVRLEQGVLTLYGVAEKENTTRVTLFDTYDDSLSYRSHLATPHFQKYKPGTLHMVKDLELIPAQRILYHKKPKLSNVNPDSVFVRLIRIELNKDAIEEYNNMGTTVMLPGIKDEPGVLLMYAVAEKEYPTRVSILEVYESKAAYDAHITTLHYNQYKQVAKSAVKSANFIDVVPVYLGFSK